MSMFVDIKVKINEPINIPTVTTVLTVIHKITDDFFIFTENNATTHT